METEATELEIQAFLARYAAHTGAALLDVGCGDGRAVGQNLDQPAFADVRYTGIDSYYWDDPAKGVHLLDSRNRTFVYGDALRMPFPDRSFDLVTATHVLEHIDDLESACKEISRVMKPSAKFLVVVPLEAGGLGNWLNKHRNLHKDLRRLLDWLGIWRYELTSPHVQFRSFDDWKHYLARYFTVEESYPRGTWLMLLLLWVHYTLQSLLRQRADFQSWLKREHPRLFSRALRRDGGLSLVGTYVLSVKHDVHVGNS